MGAGFAGGGIAAAGVERTLEDAVGQELGGVAAVVESIVERGVDVGDVKAFEVVVDVEGPVGADGVFAVARRVGLELIDWQKAEALDHRLENLFERSGGL